MKNIMAIISLLGIGAIIYPVLLNDMWLGPEYAIVVEADEIIEGADVATMSTRSMAQNFVWAFSGFGSAVDVGISSAKNNIEIFMAKNTSMGQQHYDATGGIALSIGGAIGGS